MAIDRTWERSTPTRGAIGPLVPGVEPHLACIEIDREGLVHALGPPCFPDEWLDGIGPMQVWRLEWPCGCRVAVWSVEDLCQPAWIASILSNDADVDHVLHHLALPGRVSWRADRDRDRPRDVAPERFALERQDDNGVRAVMHTFESELAAECARRTYEERGHKQLYAIERAGA